MIKRNANGFTVIELIVSIVALILFIFAVLPPIVSFFGPDFSLKYPSNFQEVNSISIDEGWILTTISLSYVDNLGILRTENYWKLGWVFSRNIYWVE